TIDERQELSSLNNLDFNNFYRNKINEEQLDAFILHYGENELHIRTKIMHATSKTPVTIKSKLSNQEMYSITAAYGETGGFYLSKEWEREYPHGNTLRTFLGKTDSIPEEDLDYHISKGYSINDEVGVSYLEKELELILHSQPNKIKFYFDEYGNIVGEEINQVGKAGSDVKLTIDIEIQKIVDRELAKYLKDNEYQYNINAFTTITNPNNGDIIALGGQTELDDNYYDYSIGNFTQAYEVGSVVKPAVLLAAYDLDVRQWGDILVDEPLHIKGTPIKKSFVTMGPIDETEAIARSSNVYFYKTLLHIAGEEYVEDQPLNIEYKYFELVRNYYTQFGLGVETGIGMENEHIGFKGSGSDPGLYLDLANGQYDTYTNLQMNQFIATIGNDGSRYKLKYIDSIHQSKIGTESGNVQKEEPSIILNQLTMDIKDIKHTKDAMAQCATYSGGTCRGKGFESLDVEFGGKSGTAESFYWDNEDKKLLLTNSTSFIGYFPAVDPKYAISTIVPNFTSAGDLNGVEDAVNLAAAIMKKIYKEE
ncbi:MAG: penicillin-binding protein 2, partial [Spiroplasma sp.]|nr:penicillin-binding protein 2 [Mycoplasmatales bacterium]